MPRNVSTSCAAGARLSFDSRHLTAPADEPFKTILAAYDAEIASILAEFIGSKEKKVFWKALLQVLKTQADILEPQVRIKTAQDKLKPATAETPEQP
jgi:hypothetical protein